jgi:hypothetical protein
MGLDGSVDPSVVTRIVAENTMIKRALLVQVQRNKGLHEQVQVRCAQCVCVDVPRVVFLLLLSCRSRCSRASARVCVCGPWSFRLSQSPHPCIPVVLKTRRAVGVAFVGLALCVSLISIPLPFFFSLFFSFPQPPWLSRRFVALPLPACLSYRTLPTPLLVLYHCALCRPCRPKRM